MSVLNKYSRRFEAVCFIYTRGGKTGFAATRIYVKGKGHKAWPLKTGDLKLETILEYAKAFDLVVIGHDDPVSKTYAKAIQKQFNERDVTTAIVPIEVPKTTIAVPVSYTKKAWIGLLQWLTWKKVWWEPGEGYLTEDYLFELGERVK